jgi:nucleotide-binding universal stress UspA family protein
VTTSSPRVGRRVLVALDASRASLDALSAAAALAARLGAELEGLFVEDVNLLRVAGLPFASQLSSLSGAPRPLERRALELELRALAEAARTALAQAAQRLDVEWSFRVARGQVSVELFEAAGNADVLVLGRTGRRVGRRPGGTARAAASRAPTSVLLVGPGPGLGQPILVAYDGSPAADRVLDLAARLDGGAGGLTVLMTAASPAEAEKLAERARRRLAREGESAPRCVMVARRQDLVRAVQASGALLVLGAAAAALGEAGLELLLEEIESPLLVVR